jgi:hypothetical protein
MENLKRKQAALIIDFMHRTIMHHVIWFNEVSERLGLESAYDLLDQAWQRTYEVQMNRLSKILGFGMSGDIPEALLEMQTDQIDALIKGAAINWLANDGVWFQAVEFSTDMTLAKECNDAAWGKFSPFEAHRIKNLLELPKNPGLDGLKRALEHRMYAYVNKQSIVDETANSFIFRMDECRVQRARQRKGLDDYPCKSGGIIEYTSFAQAVDNRIKTEVVSCPPDPHPESYFCAWRFYIDKN